MCRDSERGLWERAPDGACLFTKSWSDSEEPARWGAWVTVLENGVDHVGRRHEGYEGLNSAVPHGLKRTRPYLISDSLYL